MNDCANVLLIANNFPPVRGGSAAVYASLARCAAQRILVMAPSINYADGLPLIGWREHDRMAPFGVVRLPLLRTTMNGKPGMSGKPDMSGKPGLGHWAGFMVRDLLIRARLSLAVGRLLVRHRPRTVCVGELLASGWLVGLLRVVPGLRILVYVHGEEITTEDPYDPDCERRRRALLAADRIIVVSRFTQGAVLRLLGQGAADRVVLIENGVDTARFSPAARNADLIARYRLGRRFVFLTVCRLLEKKGVDNALRAFADLLLVEPDSCYLIVGAGPYHTALQALVAGLGIGHAVIFTGDVGEHELVEHYRLGDVFVMPNRALPNGDTEGFGLVFLEANGCGLPVIAGRDGGSRDAVRDGENGLVVDGASVSAIAAAMLRLRHDQDLRADLAQGGLRAAAAADWANRTQTFLAVCSGQTLPDRYAGGSKHRLNHPD